MKKVLSIKFVRYILILIIVAGIGVGGYYTYTKMSSAASAQKGAKETTATVKKGDISVTISGTGTIQPISRYDIIPLVKGIIISAPFEEGMDVKEGELLYKIDDSDLSYNIEKAQNNVDRLRLNNQTTVDSINNLEVTAPFSGRVTSFTLNVDDQVGNNGKVADLVDDRHLKLIVPFSEAQIKKVSVGQTARVFIGDYLNYINGEVKYVNSSPKPSSGGARVYDVEINMDNPGAVTEGMSASASILGQDEEIVSYTTSTINYLRKQSIVAQSTGKVQNVFIKEGQWINEGQKMITLDNDSLPITSKKNTLDLRDSQLSMDAQIKQLKDYNILSPISGRVIKKNNKAGDTINNANNSTNILMTVADMSKMIFNIDVDELDVSKVSVGQKVVVVADALTGMNFEGEVTNTSVEGKSSNGVTTYPVQVTIAEPGNLKPGMNVNAKIQVENKKGVLTLPMSAVTKVGKKAFVTVKDDGTASTPEKKEAVPQENSDKQQTQEGSNQQRTQRNQADSSQRASTGAQTGNDQQGTSQKATKDTTATNKATSTAASGKKQKEVVIGINNDNLIEIVSGLDEGEVVYLPTVSTNSTAKTQTNPGGGLGIPGGGAVRVR